MVQKLGLFGFVLALGGPGERKTGVGLALFGFAWVCFLGGESGIFSVTVCKKRGYGVFGVCANWVCFARKGTKVNGKW
jgi:hypothetical protein